MIYLCMEGYTCNGDSMPDQYCGRYDVETIEEAVKMWADKNLGDGVILTLIVLHGGDVAFTRA